MWQESKRITRKSLDKGDRCTTHSTQLFPNTTFGSSFGAAELFRSRSSLSIECRLFVITSRTRYFIALTLPMTLFHSTSPPVSLPLPPLFPGWAGKTFETACCPTPREQQPTVTLSFGSRKDRKKVTAF